MRQRKDKQDWDQLHISTLERLKYARDRFRVISVGLKYGGDQLLVTVLKRYAP